MGAHVSRLEHNLFIIIVLSALTILVSIACIKESPVLRIATAIVLIVVLLFRESTIGAYPRTLIELSPLEGVMLDHYRDGALAVVDYCKVTSVYVFGVSVLLIVLCVRGFRRPKQK